jgi:DNA-binding transcriptional MerR regulator
MRTKTMKNQWLIKEFGKLTNISVRTLHHYDDIGLLKPSLRADNGYRLYSEKDLLKLERVTALKFFGFSLEQIKALVGNDEDIVGHLQAQQGLLTEQIQHLRHASDIINDLVAESHAHKPVDWSKLVNLIKVYRMINDLKNIWIGEVCSSNELVKQFAELKQRFTPAQQADFEKRAAALTAKVKSNIDQDPCGPIGQALVKEWTALVDSVYGDFPELRAELEAAYKANKNPHAPFDKELWDFLDTAKKYMLKKK